MIAKDVIVVVLDHRARGVGKLNHTAVAVILVIDRGIARHAGRQGKPANVLPHRVARDLQHQLVAIPNIGGGNIPDGFALPESVSVRY